MKRRYKILVGLAAMVGILAGFLGFLLETQAGLRLAAGMVERRFHGALTLDSVEGRLAGPLTISGLHLKLSEAAVTIGKLELDWQPTALVHGQLRFSIFSASSVNITLPASDGSSAGFELPARLHFPLSLVVTKLRASSVNLHRGDRSLSISSLACALYAGNPRIGIRQLEVRGPLFDLAGKMTANPYGGWQSQAALAWTLRPPTYPVVSGTTDIDGALRREIHLHQSLSAPFTARADVNIDNVFKSPSWEGALEIAGLNPRALRSDWPSLETTAVLKTTGTLRDIRAAGTVRVRTDATYAVRLELDAGLKAEKIVIRRLQLQRVNKPATLFAAGSIATGKEFSADLDLSWQDLHWPLAGGTPRITFPRGRVLLKGRLEAWQAAVRALVVPAGLPASDWSLAATGNRETVTVSRARGRWLGGTISASGSLGLVGRRSFRARADIHDLHPGEVIPRWRGSVSFALAADGALDPLGASVLVDRFGGEFNGRRIGGAAAFAYGDKRLRVDSARLEIGKNRVRVSGNWGSSLRFDWRVDAPDLAALGSGFEGDFSASGNVAGSPRAPRISGSLAARDLRWQNLSIGSAQSAFDLAWAGGAASRFSVSLADVERDGLSLQAVTAELKGPAAAQHFSASIESTRTQLNIAADGALANGHWSGAITSADLLPARGPALRLEAPAQVFIGRREFMLDNACWTGAETAHLCLSGKSEANAWTLQAALQDLPLDIMNPFLSDGLELDGTLDASLQGSGGGGRLSIRAETHSDDLDVSRVIADERRHLHFTHLAAQADMNDTIATTRLDATLSDGGSLAAEAKIPWRASVEPAGELHLEAHLPDLSGLAALSDQVTDVAGRLDTDLAIFGSPDALHAHGTARLTGGAFTLASTGTRVQNAIVDLKGTDQGVDFQARASDGDGGKIVATGLVSKQAAGWTLTSRIEGDDFRALDIPEARITVSPELDLAVQNYSVRLNGSITVPSAQLRPPDLSGAVTPTPDLVVVGREKPAAQSRWKTFTALEIRLGDKVHFAGYGLTARIGGGIKVNDTPEKITTASGELNILDGAYKAYGQTLTIERGRLLFSGGPVDNPGLDIRATRTTGLVVAGLLVTGTLRSPRLQIFSNPPMSQSDALAYLLFGHGVQQASGSEKGTFNQAANALGIAGGTYLVRSVGKQVGVETVSVENASPYNTGSNQASLFLGRYLSPRVYVSYGIGLYSPINLFRVRYELSRHWALEAESGTISGADILYNITH